MRAEAAHRVRRCWCRFGKPVGVGHAFGRRRAWDVTDGVIANLFLFDPALIFK